MCRASALRRLGMAVSTLLLITSITLTITSLTTEQWLTARVLRRRADGTQTMAGHVHTGVFHGRRSIDYGLGERALELNIYAELSEGISFFSMETWLGMIVFALLSLVLSIVGTLFALVNTILKPVSSLAGSQGMYIWSTTARECPRRAVDHARSVFVAGECPVLRGAICDEHAEDCSPRGTRPRRLHHRRLHQVGDRQKHTSLSIGSSCYMFMGVVLCQLATVGMLVLTQSSVVHAHCWGETSRPPCLAHDPRAIMY